MWAFACYDIIPFYLHPTTLQRYIFEKSKCWKKFIDFFSWHQKRRKNVPKNYEDEIHYYSLLVIHWLDTKWKITSYFKISTRTKFVSKWHSLYGWCVVFPIRDKIKNVGLRLLERQTRVFRFWEKRDCEP